MAKHSTHRRNISNSEMKKSFLKKFNIEEDKIEMGTDDDDIKTPPIIPFDDFEENWEDIEETPDYEFLKNLHKFLSKKSFPKKCTRKFMNNALGFVRQGEISMSSLNDFIDNEKLDKKIVDEIKKRGKNKPTKSNNSGGTSDPCYTPPVTRSHC